MAPKKQQPQTPTGSKTSKDDPITDDTVLPPLSSQEFRIYNRLADQMDQFHNHFRLTWTQLQDACSSTATNKRSSSHLSPRQLITTGLTFCSQLDTHHSIEEMHVFPVLAKKMPEFRRELALLTQHKKIHKGLENLEAYLMRCQRGEEDLRREEVKRLLDAFGGVLWEHLDDEVRALGAENMRRVWSVAEMRMLPM